MFGDEQHLQRGGRSNPTHRDRHGNWLLRSTSDPGKHRGELREGPSDRGLLRTWSVRARYVDTDTRNWLLPAPRVPLGDGGVIRPDTDPIDSSGRAWDPGGCPRWRAP